MEDYYNILVSLLKSNNAKLVNYEYYKKIFGNFVVEIEFQGKVYKFITDRGEIYLDSVLLFDSSYHKVGQSDVFPKLFEAIKQELFVKGN